MYTFSCDELRTLRALVLFYRMRVYKDFGDTEEFRDSTTLYKKLKECLAEKDNCYSIRELRRGKKLTLKQLSDLSGVSVTQIQAVESGKSCPGNMSARNLLAIAKALNADPYKLLKPSE